MGFKPKKIALSSVGEIVSNSDLKICSKCNEAKKYPNNFYMCQGRPRSECKSCTISKNVDYQKRVKAWRYRFVDEEETRSYMVDYYSKNKEKFAEYRRKFKERYPEYYKEYTRKRKNERK